MIVASQLPPALSTCLHHIIKMPYLLSPTVVLILHDTGLSRLTTDEKLTDTFAPFGQLIEGDHNFD